MGPIWPMKSFGLALPRQLQANLKFNKSSKIFYSNIYLYQMNHTHNIFEGTIKEHQLQDRQDTYKFMAKRTCVSSAASNPFACIALTLRTVSPKQAGSVYAVKVLTVISLVRKKGSPARPSYCEARETTSHYNKPPTLVTRLSLPILPLSKLD